MAHLNVSLDFNSASETETGTGWRVLHWLADPVSEDVPTEQFENFYATITEALAAIEELFSSDLEVDQYFQAKAVAALVASSGGPIATSKQSLRVADGLDATV